MVVSIVHAAHYNTTDLFASSLADSKLTLYASDLLSQNGCQSMEELRQAIKRATQVCTIMHLPLNENFKTVFRACKGEVIQDWRLSPLAYMLMVINADATNDIIAQTQLEVVMRAFQRG